MEDSKENKDIKKENPFEGTIGILTVKELINRLSEFPPNLPIEVLIQYTHETNIYTRNFITITDGNTKDDINDYVELRLE